MNLMMSREFDSHDSRFSPARKRFKESLSKESLAHPSHPRPGSSDHDIPPTHRNTNTNHQPQNTPATADHPSQPHPRDRHSKDGAEEHSSHPHQRDLHLKETPSVHSNPGHPHHPKEHAAGAAERSSPGNAHQTNKHAAADTLVHPHQRDTHRKVSPASHDELPMAPSGIISSPDWPVNTPQQNPGMQWPLPIVPTQSSANGGLESPASSEESEGSMGVAFSKLSDMDSVYICPTTNVPDQILRSDSSRTYEILDYSGRRHFYAVEERQGCCGWFFGESRSFNIRVYDETGQNVFKFSRPMTCLVCMLGVDSSLNCTQETVATYKSVFIGRTSAVFSCSYPLYVIEDGANASQFTLRLPKCSQCCICKICGLREIPICSADTNVQMGKIQLGYDGLIEDTIPNPNTVSVIFPPHCSPDLKACLLGTGFMTDVTYFQRRGITCHRFLMHLLVFSVIFGGLGYGIFAIVKDNL